MELRKRQKTNEHERLKIGFQDMDRMYTLTPTEEEFKQFIPYVEGLYKQGIWKYGSIKIIPPQGFNPGN